MDKKALSYLSVGLLAGIVLTAGLFSILVRSDRVGGQGGARLVLKLAHSLPPSAPVHRGMAFMAERVAELSGGSVEVQIFPSGQLGSETETIEQLQRGALAMVKTSTAAMEGFVPEMRVFGIPYLFTDSEHFWRVAESDLGQELLRDGIEVNIRGLCYYDAGARSFYTVDGPVLSPADLRGKKIRTMRSEMAMDMISEMGGSPTPMPFGELYTALQQGIVDGAENNPPSMWDSRHWEVARHYSLERHTRIPDMLIISESVWQSLPGEVQGWIEQAVAESVPYQREVWNRYVADSMEQLQAEGVTVYKPALEPFQEAVEPIYDRLEGDMLEPLIERALALREP